MFSQKINTYIGDRDIINTLQNTDLLSLTLLLFVMLLLLLGIIWLIIVMRNSRVDQAQLECMSTMMLNVNEAVVLMDSECTIQYINPAAEKIIKYKLRSAKGKKVYHLFKLSDSETRHDLKFLTAPLNLKEEKSAECFFEPVSKAGLFVDVRLIPIEVSKKYALMINDLTEAEAFQSRLNYLETHDELTQFLNRNAFTRDLTVALNRAKYHGQTHVYGHLSIDQYRLINDSLGHNATENLIKKVAHVIKVTLRQRENTDIVRLGGDEFGVLMRKCSPTEGLKLADVLRQCIADLDFSWNGVKHEVTASMGLVLVSKVSVNTSRVFSAADAARQVAKEKGGNRTQIFRKDDMAIQKQRAHAKWAGRLKNAFKKDQFSLFAQPIHPLAVGQFEQKYSHYEILIRFYDNAGNQVSPDEFIPAAEYYDMMTQLDKWVIKRVLMNLKQITQKIPLPVFSINLSGQSLDSEGFLKFVLDEIRAAEIRPQMLCFEITETVAITNLDLAMDFIKILKDLGCRFSLDDFGTGMSSFEYLKTLPVDYLKIDGSFVKEIVTDDIQKAMVRSINQVGHMMGIEIIAEYVENDQIIQELRQIGIDYGQGYGISKPIPLSEAVRAHCLE